MTLPQFTSALQPTPEAGLPQEILPLVDRRKLWRDLVAALVLFLMINFAAYLFLGHYTSNYGFWVIKNKWRLLLELDAPVDWLILGDSSANQGIMPSIIQSEAGKSSLNLGTIGNMTLVDNLWMLEEYIEHHGPPEKVVMIHVYDMWHRNFNPMLLAHVPLSWGFWEHYRLSEELISEDIEDDLFIERYFPLYTQNRTLRQIIFTSLSGFQNPLKLEYKIDSHGYFPATEPYPEVVVLGAKDHIEFVETNTPFISYSNQIVFQELIHLAETYEMDIYIVNSPIYEGLYQAQPFQEYFEDLNAALEDISQSSNYLHYISEVRTFPDEQMQNPDHLISSGAEIYTRWVIEQVGQ